ncbi:MAG: DNA repair protein RadC [Nitrospiria bacterium]
MATIKEWPQGERPRERLLERGSSVLTDAQLLAIVLRTGSDRENALQLAMNLSKKFHPLSRMTQVGVSELCSVRGIGPAKAAQLMAAFELGRRSLAVPLSGSMKFLRSRDIFNHFSPLLKGLKKECFKIILLDQKNKVIRDETVSEGSLSTTVVHPREVFVAAVRESAASVIFAHNHPSGDPSPSHEDCEMTKRLVTVGELMGIPVLDHVIIGSETYYSFADAGQIRQGDFLRSVSESSEQNEF